MDNFVYSAPLGQTESKISSVSKKSSYEAARVESLFQDGRLVFYEEDTSQPQFPQPEQVIFNVTAREFEITSKPVTIGDTIEAGTSKVGLTDEVKIRFRINPLSNGNSSFQDKQFIQFDINEVLSMQISNPTTWAASGTSGSPRFQLKYRDGKRPLVNVVHTHGAFSDAWQRLPNQTQDTDVGRPLVTTSGENIIKDSFSYNQDVNHLFGRDNNLYAQESGHSLLEFLPPVDGGSTIGFYPSILLRYSFIAFKENGTRPTDPSVTTANGAKYLEVRLSGLVLPFSFITVN